MHFSCPLLNIEPKVNLLPSVQLHNWNSDLLVLVFLGKKFHGQNLLFIEVSLLIAHINWLDVQRSHLPNWFHGILRDILVMHLKSKLKLTNLAIVKVLGRTITLPRILVLIHLFTAERNQTYSLSQEFIMEDRCIFNHWNQMRGHCRNFGN